MRVRSAIAAGALALISLSGAALAEPSPAAAPHAVAPAQNQSADAAFIDWARGVMQALERANRAMAPFLQINSNMENLSPEQALAELRNLSRQAGQARAEMAAARSDLESMAAFAHPGATPEVLGMGSVLLRDSRASIAHMEGFLGDLIAFAEAVERGDEAEMDRLMPRVDSGALVLVQSQATMLRARQQMMPALSSTYHALGGMASMYDGMAALMTDDAGFDAGALETAASALDASIAAERAAIVLERAGLRAADPNHAVLSQIVSTHAQFADANERARDVLRAAAREGRAGASTETARTEHIRALARLEYEYQALSRRQLELHGQLLR